MQKTMKDIILTIVWLLLGGLLIAVTYSLLAVACFISIIFIPLGIQSVKLARCNFCPFGYSIQETGEAQGCISTIYLIIWILNCGIYMAVYHIFLGCIFYITILGIPLGRKHFEMARFAIIPFGKDIVEV